MLNTILVLLSFFLVSGCIPVVDESAPERMSLKHVGFSDIGGWDTDNHVEALNTFLKSCGDFNSRNDGDAIGKNEFLAPVIVWKKICLKASVVPADDEIRAKKFFESEFTPMKASSDKSEHAFITGYYEPFLSGLRVKSPPFIYPVYAMPQGGTTYTRQQIDSGLLKNQATVIAYVDDPVQLFFMHIQGSGSIQLDGGEIIHIGYAGNNRQPYVAIGKVLVDKGILDKKSITMQVLRQWLYDHPNDMWQIMWQNTSYIFFQEMNGGPFGSEEVALTPGRSLAVDKNYIPLGMPVFVDTVLPGNSESPFLIHRKLMVAQDTGRAITGPMRGDIFFGAGDGAEQVAGNLKSGGDFILLVPCAIAQAPEGRNIIKSLDDFFNKKFNSGSKPADTQESKPDNLLDLVNKQRAGRQENNKEHDSDDNLVDMLHRRGY